MDPVPEQRTPFDRRTVLVASTAALPEAVQLATACGWHLSSASRTAHGVELVLRR